MDSDLLILVNEDDEEIGSKPKLECHQNDGVLHRAFSIFIFNDHGEVLIQRRSKDKMLWPGYWSNACCSHPRKGEELNEAVHRRLLEELRFDCDLTYLYKFIYKSHFMGIGTEHELCSVWKGLYSGDIDADESEIMDWCYISTDELDRRIQTSPDSFTPWMLLEWNQVKHNYLPA